MHTIYIAQQDAKDLMDLHIQFDILFPENHNNIPVTMAQLVTALPEIWAKNKIIGTTSEVVPLWISHQIATGKLIPGNITLYEVSKDKLIQYVYDDEGDFETHWANGFLIGVLIFYYSKAYNHNKGLIS